MFSAKTSDVFYNDEEKDLYVCQVSAISAERCEPGFTDEITFGALPIIYKIIKGTNKKTVVYPKNLDTFLTDTNSDLFALTTKCTTTSATNFSSISKPLVSFNENSEGYSVTFLGRYETSADGVSINNYVFQYVDDSFHLLDYKTYVPEDKNESINVDARKYTFENGFINSDYYVAGNTIRHKYGSWYDEAEVDTTERAPNYMVAPTYVESTSSLGFNLIQDELTDQDAGEAVTTKAITGDANFPFMYSGGFITVNPKYAAFDPNDSIRVEFQARSFNVAAPTAYGSTQATDGLTASRWIQQYSPSGPGEGFCVYFYKTPLSGYYTIPNGVGDTLGYSPSQFSSLEVAGTINKTIGVYEHSSWNPLSGVRESGTLLDGKKSDTFLGVGFDIGGSFGVEGSNDKPGWFTYQDTSWTATPCSVAVRGSSFYNNRVLGAVALSSVAAASAVPMHTSAANAEFVDYRIDLTNKGNDLTIYNKLTGDTDYNIILQLRLDKLYSSETESYVPWNGMKEGDKLPLINVGLSFTTSTKVSQFELKKFKVSGNKITNPWEKKKKLKEFESIAPKDNVTNYINKSSDNLRQRTIDKSVAEVDIIIPSKCDTVAIENSNAEITLCDYRPDEEQEQVEAKATGVVTEIKRTVEQRPIAEPPIEEPEIEVVDNIPLILQDNWKLWCQGEKFTKFDTGNKKKGYRSAYGILYNELVTNIAGQQRKYILFAKNTNLPASGTIIESKWSETFLSTPGSYWTQLVYQLLNPYSGPGDDFITRVDNGLDDTGFIVGSGPQQRQKISNTPFTIQSPRDLEYLWDIGFMNSIYHQSALDKISELFFRSIKGQENQMFWSIGYPFNVDDTTVELAGFGLAEVYPLDGDVFDIDKVTITPITELTEPSQLDAWVAEENFTSCKVDTGTKGKGEGIEPLPLYRKV